MANTERFEKIANMYDTPERIHIAERASDAIRKYIGDGRRRSAIDFGCGTGLVGMNLIRDFHSMLFLDTSPSMIAHVKQKISDGRIKNADTLVFDFEQEGSAHLHADVIFMAQVLLHIPDVEAVLTRLYEVLNQGGHLLIVDFNRNEQVVSDLVHNGFDQDELRHQMSGLGYTEIQSETFYTGSKLFMGQDASVFVLDAQKPAHG